MGFQVLNSSRLSGLRPINYASTADAGLLPPPPLANMEGWWDGAVDYVTKDVNNLVSAWNDRSGKGRHFTQATGSKQPVWSASGLTFDGVSQVMTTAAINLAEPYTIFVVMNQITWAANQRIIGNSNNYFLLWQADSTPDLSINAAASVNHFADLAANTLGIVSIIFNGAASKTRVNAGEPTTLTSAAQNIVALGLGEVDATGSNYGNVLFADIILYSGAVSTANETLVRNYLNSKRTVF